MALFVGICEREKQKNNKLASYEHEFANAILHNHRDICRIFYCRDFIEMVYNVINTVLLLVTYFLAHFFEHLIYNLLVI